MTRPFRQNIRSAYEAGSQRPSPSHSHCGRYAGQNRYHPGTSCHRDGIARSIGQRYTEKPSWPGRRLEIGFS